MSVVRANPNFKATLVIPTRDRLGYLKLLLHWAANRNPLIKKILIFDMESTYPKMNAFLDNLSQFGFVGLDGVQVSVFIVPNKGARSLFSDSYARSLLQRELGPNERFLLSDPDVLPEIVDRKGAMITALHKVLDLYPRVAKAGCALRIDDLPDHFPQKKKVVAWERRFWDNPVDDFGQFHGALYKADIATTFCMVRRLDAVNTNGDGPSMRLAGPYIARHLPWYEDPSNLSPDLIHYYKRAPMRRWGHAGPGVSWSPFKEPNR